MRTTGTTPHRRVTPLGDAFTLVAVEGTGLGDDDHIDRDVQHVAVLGNTLAVQHVHNDATG